MIDGANDIVRALKVQVNWHYRTNIKSHFVNYDNAEKLSIFTHYITSAIPRLNLSVFYILVLRRHY
jgi:hypothetical protein